MGDFRSKGLLCIIIHVDDLLVCAMREIVRWVQRMVGKGFGALKRHERPFTYCGIVHELLGPNHYLLHQTPYLDNLKPMKPTGKIVDQDLLNAVDDSQLRSRLMSML